MNILFWFIGAIGAALVSLLITLILDEPMKGWLTPIVAKFGVKRKYGISGIWVATFKYRNGNVIEEYSEAIEVKTLFGLTVGRIIPHQANHPRLKSVETEKPLRVRGYFEDNRYFTGIWYHPLERHRYHGAFQLILDPSGIEMKGKWIGYSGTKIAVDEENWIWKLIEP